MSIIDKIYMESCFNIDNGKIKYCAEFISNYGVNIQKEFNADWSTVLRLIADELDKQNLKNNQDGKST